MTRLSAPSPGFTGSLQRLKYNTYIKARVGWHGLSSEEHQDTGPYLITGTDFLEGRIDWKSCTHISVERWEQDPYIQVREGDLLVTKDGTIGKIALVNGLLGKATLNSGVFVLRPLSLAYLTKFLFYILRSKLFRDFIDLISHGSTINHLYQRQIKEFSFPLPPVPTQEAIADFLDRKTAAIDASIEKKQKLLRLLIEKRAALINQAVTKGLDPNVPMKDSGIPWIGGIPAHWDCAPLYSRYQVQLGKMLDTSRQTGTDNAAYLRNADIQWDRVNIEDLPQMDFSRADRTRFALRRGDILMCEGGANRKVVGRSAIWEEQLDECYYQKALHRIRAASSRENPRFLVYVARTACHIGVFVADANANIFHLTAEKLRAMRFPFPAPDEQNLIVSFLDRRLEVLGVIERLSLDEISKLQEYRQALITAAVTGQVHVPEEKGSEA